MTIGALIIIALLIAFFKGSNRKIGFWWALYFSIFFGALVGYIITNNSAKKEDSISDENISPNAKYFSLAYVFLSIIIFYSYFFHLSSISYLFLPMSFGFIGSAIYVMRSKKDTPIDIGIVMVIGVIYFILYSNIQNSSINSSSTSQLSPTKLSSDERAKIEMDAAGFETMPTFNLSIFNLDSLTKQLIKDTKFYVTRTFYIDSQKLYLVYVDPKFNYQDSIISHSTYKDFYSVHMLGVADNIDGIFIYKNFSSDSANSPTFAPKLLWGALRPHRKVYNDIIKKSYGDNTN